MNNIQKPSTVKTDSYPENELDNQPSTEKEVRKQYTTKYLPQQKVETQPESNTIPRKLSSKDRTVIEFSAFCLSFYSKDEESEPHPFPDDMHYIFPSDEVDDFCKLIRLHSHSHKRLFNDITDIIKVDSHNNDLNREKLRKLVYSRKYNGISGIQEARNTLRVDRLE